MAPFFYRCPNSGRTVQAWAVDDVGQDNDYTYQEITCLACFQAHLVYPKTGKILGAEDQ